MRPSCAACRREAPLGELLRVESIASGAAWHVHRPGFGPMIPAPCFRSVGPAAVHRIELAEPPSGIRPAMHRLEDRWLEENAQKAALLASEPRADQW